LSEKLSRFRDSARKLHPYFQSRLPDGESSSLSFLLSLKISQVSSSGAVVNSSDGRRHLISSDGRRHLISSDGRRHLISSDGRRQFFRRSTSSHLFRRSTPILPTVDAISSLPTVDVISSLPTVDANSSDGRRHLISSDGRRHLFRRSTPILPTVDVISSDGRRHLFRRSTPILPTVDVISSDEPSSRLERPRASNRGPAVKPRHRQPPISPSVHTSLSRLAPAIGTPRSPLPGTKNRNRSSPVAGRPQLAQIAAQHFTVRGRTTASRG